MKASRRTIIRMALAAVALGVAPQVRATGSGEITSDEVMRHWYRLVLELVRHTPTYSPPVASRAFAYLGVTAFEAVASGSNRLQSLAGQLNGLTPLPQREAGTLYDDARVVDSAMAFAAKSFFSNTGPTGQRALKAMAARMREKSASGLPSDVLARSEAHGLAIGQHILAWSLDDGGAVVENMGFPLEYTLTEGPEHWVPTSLVAQQQLPLLPNWARNRTFATPDGAACGLPNPPAYSEDMASDFYREALEVYTAVNDITADQRIIARFWSDDPMLSPTPPGHWISIALHVLARDKHDAEKTADVLARLGITLADAFIGCWDAKFKFDLVRPLTYIHRVIDPKWEAPLNTPPFPEYPSGHSTQSGAAAVVLAHMFGENFAFEDATHAADGLPPRSFASFWDAAEEAGISRLYGGIHFRSAIERGLDQGRCIGAYANALKTRR
ncbi:vanadium-dependent haloperoxidase [Pararhizobium antarcticum]|uniref:Phosphoesterase PA-phosphatase n=1 Tax=Pararhizobium antarcticum TaxID=1798805 RepID=A0A657LQA1_9HYPH|nr:vanadium-dependent haloperoxidase [Pararhizobium antarcticum]OJF93608.1 phosphoesterase PA-phosphatase [Rhizobium sp. 58]OJF94987.1 phosphoesterase PA-phosphatase [Pararhizobium antarcticum]